MFLSAALWCTRWLLSSARFHALENFAHKHTLAPIQGKGRGEDGMSYRAR